jgi:hypothetical protein
MERCRFSEPAMLNIGRRSSRFCEGISRRELLRVGGLGAFGLMLPDLLAGRAKAAGTRAPGFGRAKSCIVGFLWGGPAHQDLWDLKPEAPAEVRGEFKPIATSAPGVSISELLPRTARVAHRFALVRSVTHPDNTHTIAMHYMLSGTRHLRPNSNPMNAPDDFPCFGSVVQKLRPSRGPLPSGISVNAPAIEYPSGHIFPGFFAGFLGNRFDPMFVSDNPAEAAFQPLPRLEETGREALLSRDALLESLDQWRRRLDTGLQVREAQHFHERAIGLLTSPAAVRAFDLNREPGSLRDRFGRTAFGQGLLLARRLVEAGVELVTVNWSRDYHGSAKDLWDTHTGHFGKVKRHLAPALDAALSTLLLDLDQRGLLDETLVVIMGEFGRSPKVNAQGGRDHWAACNSILLAGSGIRGGVIYGASDRIAAWPSDKPVGPEDIAATLYHALGMPAETHLIDRTGRPLVLCRGRSLTELLG